VKRKLKALIPKHLSPPRLGRRRKSGDAPPPRITNNTVAANREEVIGSARKYILPLTQSKNQIVRISVILFIVALVTFTTYSLLSLYRFKSTSTFLYRITQVIPFPVAKTGPDYVAYENYLFELRRYTHFYVNQQRLNFQDEDGAQQLADFKTQALNKVIAGAYVRQLAEANGVSVSGAEIDQQISIVRNQNRLGSSDDVFEDVLRDYWGWSVSDFRRSLQNELLAQKVVAKLDTATTDRASAALAELTPNAAGAAGADFAAVAAKASDDDSKANGGEYGFPIEKTSRNVNPAIIEALFKLKPGQTSGIINTGFQLQIVKNIETNDNKIRAAHIVFNFKDAKTYIDQQKTKAPERRFINP